MKVNKKYYTEIFDFKGLWDMPSKCGLKIIDKNEKKLVITTELYQDNPGTSITDAGVSLLLQICEAKNMDLKNVTYIQCNPDTNSKLSFYNEAFFQVTFFDTDGKLTSPIYRQLSTDEIKNIEK